MITVFFDLYTQRRIKLNKLVEYKTYKSNFYLGKLKCVYFINSRLSVL